MGFQDITDRGVADWVANVGQRTLDSIIAPQRIFFGELQDQINDNLANTGPTNLFLLPIRKIPFLGYQLTMPPQNRVGRKQGAELFQQSSAKCFAFDSQPSTLVVAEQDAFFPSLSFSIWFSVRRYSITRCCSSLIQEATIDSSNCQG